MKTTVVTQGQWKAVLDTEPRKKFKVGKEGAKYPATHVSWNDAVAYCKKLSETEGKTYRLPTEAKWEYGCRAKSTTSWNCGDNQKELGDYAWYKENTVNVQENHAHEVRQKKSNAFGLCDIHGNVYEWSHVYYGEDYYIQSLEKDPTGPPSGSFRVSRGGSWSSNSRHTRSAYRNRTVADGRYYYYGFRLVRELD